MIEQFAPYWDHNLGYGKLATAAFHSGNFDIAERFILKLKQSQNWERAKEIGFLAEIWHNRGKTEEAHARLIECLKRLIEESKTANGSDRNLFEKWFQQHRSTYLKLFPDKGEETLEKNGIPTTTRREPGASDFLATQI